MTEFRELMSECTTMNGVLTERNTGAKCTDVAEGHPVGLLSQLEAKFKDIVTANTGGGGLPGRRNDITKLYPSIESSCDGE